MSRAPMTGRAGSGGHRHDVALPEDPTGRPAPPPRGPGIVLLVALAVAASALAGPWDPQFGPAEVPDAVPDPEPDQVLPMVTPTPDPLFTALTQTHIEPWDLTWLWVAVVVVLGGLLLVLLVRFVLARLPRADDDLPDDAGLLPGGTAAASGTQPDLPTMREGIADAGQQLQSPGRPADAVIAAWVALEDAAAGSGVARDPAATPTEFTVAVLDRTPADPTATRTLLALYLRARFGDERLTPDDVAAAGAAVDVLARGLADEGSAPR